MVAFRVRDSAPCLPSVREYLRHGHDQTASSSLQAALHSRCPPCSWGRGTHLLVTMWAPLAYMPLSRYRYPPDLAFFIMIHQSTAVPGAVGARAPHSGTHPLVSNDSNAEPC